MKFLHLYCLFICAVNVVRGKMYTLDRMPEAPFDQELYASVLNPELCEQQINYMRTSDQSLLLQMLDAGFRIPTGLLQGNGQHLGNYFQCLDIKDKIEEKPLQGKYCIMKLPLDQTLEIPFAGEVLNVKHLMDNHMQMIEKYADNINKLPIEGFNTLEMFKGAVLRFGLCIPQACTLQEWVTHMFANVSAVGIQIEQEYCRLPDDKPWVAVDWVAVGIFSTLGLLTILSTCYDVHYSFILQRDRKRINQLYSCFSVYTNAKRLTTFTKSNNTLDCLDGIRSISMIWVIIGHSFSMYNHLVNLLDLLDFMVSGPAVLISTGLFAVDTFFLMAGLLLVYTAVGKMKPMQLLKGLHMFYIHRILRLFPLLAALVLLEASFVHKIADGPFWMDVAMNTERCRDWWWTTLLFVQNYVNPTELCLRHSWYLAIDMQLHIISPLVLFWVLSGKRRMAWSALLGGLLAILTSSTIFNFVMDMTSTHATLVRMDDVEEYLRYFYYNTLTRASPFFFGMILGYILNITKGQKVKMPKLLVILFWIISLGMLASVFAMKYFIMQLDYDSQLGDNLFNSFSKTAWSLGLSWLIFACVHGYGGPINWFLSLYIWKIPSRISYAMYLYHYTFMFVGAGMQLAPIYFTPAKSLYDSLAHFSLSFLACFALTVVIDSPFSTLTKMAMGGGPKRRSPEIRNKPEPEVQTENGIQNKIIDKTYM